MTCSLLAKSTVFATTSHRRYSRLLVVTVFAVRPHQGPALSSFQPVTIEEGRKLLSAMPSKSSPLDVLPCSLLKSCSEVFAPVIARLANLSMQTGKFPARYKLAQVLPLLKKAGLDSSSPANYRPISNLATVSKVIERLVLTRLRPHLLGSTNFSEFPSAYWKGHSTESALLDILDGVYTAADKRQQGSHSADRSRPVCSVRHSRP